MKYEVEVSKGICLICFEGKMKLLKFLNRVMDFMNIIFIKDMCYILLSSLLFRYLIFKFFFSKIYVYSFFCV